MYDKTRNRSKMNERVIMKDRISLSGITSDKPVTNLREGVQRRLYNNVLWGCYNNEGIKISKLELNIRGLFPFSIGCWRLEYGRIEIYILSEISNSFDLILDVIRYQSYKSITFISQRSELNMPLVILPTLTRDNVVLIDGVKKTLTMQLIRNISVVFDRDNEVINMVTRSLSHLKIHGSRIKCGDCDSDLLTTMLWLKSKYSHILKNISDLTHLCYYKGRWRKFDWKRSSLDISASKYGRKRLSRHVKNIVGCCHENSVVCSCFVINQHGNVIVNMGDKLDLDVNLLTKHIGGLRITETSDPFVLELFKTIGRLISSNLCYKSDIGSKHISDVDLTLIGRCTLNDITCNNQDFGLDLLTKKDLVLLWTKHVIGRTNFRSINCDIKIIKGSGDYLTDIIYNHLASILNSQVVEHPSEYLKKPFTIDSNNVVIKALLESSTRIQKHVDKCFNSSSRCQYLDQVNSLSELSHKNKLICMGEGGLTQQNADNYARDTKRWHLAKICPIESPEGQNIGLILSLTTSANVDVNGHIITGYFKTSNGLVSNNVVYLNYYECKDLKVSMSHRNDSSKWTLCFYQGTTIVVDKRSVDLTLTTEAQVFSSAVCLIPFLEHNDPTRALMAANMQKQAIPLLKPQGPLIGTGEEHNVMRNTGDNITALNDGMVTTVDSNKVIIYESGRPKHRVYTLPTIEKTNQETCQRIRNVVNPGQMVRSGDVIAECQSSCNGEMSLGANLLVAFMCWKGYNYEDSVILSESVINKGTFKSMHIMDLESKVMKTKHGDEWLSADIIEIPMKYRRHLDSNGIVKVGSNVREGDVLVGKLVPRNDERRDRDELLDVHRDVERTKRNDNEVIKIGTDVGLDKSDELDDRNKQIIEGGDNKLDVGGLISDIGDDGGGWSVNSACDDEGKGGSIDLSSNVSLRVPNGIEHATVIEVKREKLNEGNGGYDGAYEEWLRQYNMVTKKYIKRCSSLLQQNMVDYFSIKLPFTSKDKYIRNALSFLFKHYLNYIHKIEDILLDKVTKRLGSDDPNDELKVLEVIKIKLFTIKSIKVGDKICGRHGNKGVISKIVPKEDMPFMDDGTPIDIILNPLGVPSRMNIGQILEANFGLISYKLGLEFKYVLNMYYKTNDDRILEQIIPKLTELYPNVSNLTKDTILVLLTELSRGVKISCPLVKFPLEPCLEHFNKRLSVDFSGKLQLHDGITGLPFKNKTTVGIIYIFKLNHLVDDKIHARSTGPYSIVTQQPLKGKSYKGGQRLGEMEVWALQSYGASYFLRESITVKCDDMLARSEIKTNIQHGNLKYKAYRNEGLVVLIKELFAMCIDIKLKTE
ncbi:DNA-directed RNA polymerase subunit beta [Candidatus Hodgkinia cicadicola]|nr:DNA-directed RNA polymerase subunit beta [Candidatus Hodgkinia cicadicola]